MKYNTAELRRLTDLPTNRGPGEAWLLRLERAKNPYSSCGETQNAAHLIASRWEKGESRRGGRGVTTHMYQNIGFI